jgi:hypothetical protein
MGSFCKSASLLISTLILCMDAQAGATLNAKLSDIKPSQTDVGKAHVEFSKLKFLNTQLTKK